MREVIQQILESEKKASEVVEAAKAEAARIRSRAEAEAASALMEAREKAQRLLKEEAARAREQSAAAHREALRKAEEENQRFLRTREQVVRDLVDRVVSFLLVPEYRRES